MLPNIGNDAKFEIRIAVWIKLPILWEVTPCCESNSWCFAELYCLFIGWSTATKGTLWLPDTENESSTFLWKELTWWQSATYQKIVYSVKCDVQLFSSFSVDSCVMNILERAYNCFLINYKACIWGFVSSGMLNFVKCGNGPLSILKLHNGFILKGACWHRKSHQALSKYITSKLLEPLTQEYGVTSQKTVILNPLCEDL